MNTGGQLYALTKESQAAAIAAALGHGRERRSRDTWTTFCPVHEADGLGNPDLDIKVKDGRVLLHCQSRGCENTAIIDELKARGLWPDRDERHRAARLTLAEFAAAKKLPVEFLLAHDVAEATSRNQPVLHFRYRREDGTLAPRYRVRVSIDGPKKFFWDRESAEPIGPYGLHRLPAARASDGFAVLVEGESDALTLWMHDISALGFPGNTTANKLLSPRILDGLRLLVISQEHGEAGKKFRDDIIARLKLLRWTGKVRIINWPANCKDPSALHIRDAAAFGDEFNRLIKAGELIEFAATGAPLVTIDAGAYLSDTTAAAWDALRVANDARAIPRLYDFGGTLVRVETDGAALRMRTLREAEVRGEVVRAAAWLNAGGEPRTPTRHQIEDIIQIESKPVPALRRISGVPVFAPDGSLIATPGFHPKSGILYLPDRDLIIPPVADAPGHEDRLKAYNLIGEMLEGFPFAAEADKAHAIALILLPFVREMVDGPTPIHRGEAPVPRTGKGLLIEQCLAVGIGTNYSHLGPPPESDYQFVQAINTGLRAGHQAFFFDNILKFLNSAYLAKTVTSPFWSERLLGGNETLRIEPFNTIWVVAGNNPQLSDELYGRSVRIRLDAKIPDPENRIFKVDLPPWVKRNRAVLIWSALTLTRHWLAVGSPKPAAKPLGRFENWVRVLGGIIEAAGIEGFLSIRPSDDKGSAPGGEAEVWATFVAQWWDFANPPGEEPKAEQSIKDLIPVARGVSGMWLGAGGTDRGEATALGTALRRRRDWVIAPVEEEPAKPKRPPRLRIIYTGTANRPGGWKLVAIENQEAQR